MNRVFIICLSVMVFAGCKKSDDAVKQVQAQGIIDDQAIKDYISKNGLAATKLQVGKADTTGIWIVNTTIGSSPALISSATYLTVGYAGRQLGSTAVFAQTNNFHPSYQLSQMIQGWRLAFAYSGIKKGGKIRLLLASRYAYGPYAQPTLGLPGNAILDFDIELFDVTN